MNMKLPETREEVIQSILEAKSDQEVENIISLYLLMDGEHEIDSDFLKMMMQVAQEQLVNGNDAAAGRLVNYAHQFANALNLPPPEPPPLPPEIAARLNLLLNFLTAIPSNNWNSEPIVYPLAIQNQDLLDEGFITVLVNWSMARFFELEPQQAEYLAEVLADLGDKFKNFPAGDRAMNIEIAIAAYEMATRILTYDTHPDQWAKLQSILGSLYPERKRGDRAQNIEIAIECCEAALKARANQEPPQLAFTQGHLGRAYCLRMEGDRRENLTRGIQYFKAALRGFNWQNDLPYPEKWAEILLNLAKATGQLPPDGNRRNLKFQIRCSEAALRIFTRHQFHERWDDIHADLSLTYSELGAIYLSQEFRRQQHNVEFAIACYRKAALSARDPINWAMCIQGLGEAYKRDQKDKQQSLEKAIRYYQAALKVLTKYRNASAGDLDFTIVQKFAGSDHPPDQLKAAQRNLLLLWATAHNQLYNAYLERTLGDRGENLEKAIQHCELILEQVNRQDEPELWGNTQTCLGLAYGDRVYGEYAENIEFAIGCHRAALAVLEPLSEDWASAQWNLGVAYKRRIRGDQAKNLETAIDCLQEAQKVLTRHAFPEEWARIQIVLGSVYRTRIWSDQTRQLAAMGIPYTAQELENLNQRGRAENLEATIRCYESALEVLTRDTAPEQWAELQDNLGNVYSERILGQPSDNLETAIRSFDACLEVFTRQNSPEQWAMAHSNLGLTYYQRILGDRSDNLQQGIRHSLLALEVFTESAFPYQHVGSLVNLGLIYQATRQFHEAYRTFEQGIQVVDALRSAIIAGSTREDDKQKLAEQFHQLYRRIVEVCLELASTEPDYGDRAVEVVERSKTRNLVELLSAKGFYPSASAYAEPSQFEQTCRELDRFRLQVPVVQRQIETFSRQSLEPNDQQRLEQFQRELDALLTQQNQLFEKIAAVDPSFQLAQPSASITFADVLRLIDQDTAIIEWYFTKEQIITFIITHQNSHPIALQFTLETPREFWQFSLDYLTTYHFQKKQWHSTLMQGLDHLAQLLHLDEVLANLPANCTQLVLIPHEFLHSFPLHALPLPGQPGAYLLDRFQRGIRYAPSCQLLRLSQQRQPAKLNRLFAIQNPTDDLDYTNVEVEAIRTFFPLSEVLAGQAASEVAVKMNQTLEDANCCHFSCHGYFDPASPLNSALVLAKPQPASPAGERTLEDGYLTLAEIFGLNLKRCQLVTLSACETGMIDPMSLSDEYVGLPSGFLYAGSPTVVSSLWTVNDLSTAFLMIRFYENLKQHMTVAIALNQAQRWLRDVSGQQLKQWVAESKVPLSHSFRVWWLNKIKDDAHPFQHPFYWAAFCAIGQ